MEEIIENYMNFKKSPSRNCKTTHCLCKKQKDISKNWTVEVWEKYLERLETCSTERLLKNPYVDQANAKGYIRLLSSISNSNYRKKSQKTHFLENLIEQTLQELLTPREYQAIKLHFWHDKSFSEVAMILNVSRGTAQTFIQRGKLKIKKAFGNYGFPKKINQLKEVFNL